MASSHPSAPLTSASTAASTSASGTPVAGAPLSLVGFGIVLGSAALFGMLGPLSRFAYAAGMEPAAFVAWRAAFGFLIVAAVMAVRARGGTRLINPLVLPRADRLGLVVVALPDAGATRVVVLNARRANPTVPILARVAREEYDEPPRAPRDREKDRARQERRQRQCDPQPGRSRRIEQTERDDEWREQRRIVEQPEAARALEAHVVQRPTVQQTLRGRVVGEEVIAEGVTGDRERRTDERHERDGSHDRQGGPDK